jgi:hypothetical protein
LCKELNMPGVVSRDLSNTTLPLLVEAMKRRDERARSA